MQAISSDCDTSSTSFGQRRGISDLARFALDLTWATPTRAESETPARPRAYPSPPMSGSPPLPPKPNPEAGDRGQLHGSYPSTSPQDAYRGGLPPTTIPQGDYRGPPPPPHSLPPPQPRSYHPEQQDRMPYSYPRPDDHLRTAPSGYAHLANQASQALQQRAPPPYMHMSGPPPPQPTGPHQHGYASTMSQTSQDSGPYTSPKTQRKTKGHVASACVPCKRAHLRFADLLLRQIAQRPCSRCTSNGKEDACVDVQHKKRGRPRLRDDREARYGPSTYQHPQDAAAAAAAARRPPLSHYSAGTPISGYDDPIRGSHSYRVLKSQPSEPIAPRYLDRAPMGEANLYSQPPSLASGSPEPVVFLTTELEIARASPAFADAVGIPNVRGRSLFDIVVPTEREKLQSHQRQIQEERTRKDPVYLPPIFGRQEQERVFDSLRFEADEISRFQLDRQDFFVFAASDGQPRSYSVRLGLAKRESIYFIVLLVNAAPRYPYPSPSPHAREMPYPYPPQQQAYAQHTPVSATFEQPRPRFGEGALAPRPSPGQPLHMASGLSPGISPGMPSYAASPSRPEYASGPSSYQIPRSELPPTARPPQPSFQLPPIRAGPHQPPQSESSSWQRDERSGRVDIGGLLEKPDPQQRRPQ
ncbi:hypothetical protein BDP81DRAFT_321391 [Colletotrichum phormii]|uniref:Uncharacterized protein n=1 Tax=Colletotrichum phormii TaxID=359342 RepID=A0AAI9ZR11_9PEZI|nr:uncharacterized protein BDP81DRAFT_321391 [Colletotrichum phormii]KAK1635418.1 hypothetical protein BDP81DRAFT_321391 [Colletotrichum phormii]